MPVALGFAATVLLTAGCQITPTTRVVSDCLIGSNNSCVAADLKGASLVNVDLRGTDLSLADLRRADLRGSDLSGANLFLANLKNAQLQGTRLSGANLIGTTCPDGRVAVAPKSGGAPSCRGRTKPHVTD